MRKLWAAMALCIVMAIPVNAAEVREVFTSGEYEYALLEDGTAEITNYSGSDEELDVPGELDGYAVTSIGAGAFFWRSNLTSVTLPEGLTSIGDSAFSGCGNLESINLPEGLASIGDWAFSSCSSLTSIILPNSLSKIEMNPFRGCAAISFIVSPDHPYCAVIDGVLFSKTDKRLIYCPGHYKTYDIPSGIVSIGGWAFSGCSNLMSITLPDSLTTVEECAFYYCEGLTSITLPEGLTSIGYDAFSYCSNLTSITLPDSLTSIGDMAFEGCENLTITVERDSYAAEYCKTNGLNYTYPDATDWLNS